MGQLTELVATEDECDSTRTESSNILIDEAVLINQYRSKLINMLTGMTRDASRAEDIAHDAFIVVLTKLRNNEIRMRDKVAIYLFSTAKFLYLGSLRKKDSQLEFRGDFEQQDCNRFDPEQSLEIEEMSNEVRNAIGTLSVARDQEILERHYIKEQTKPEICEALELSSDHFDRVISRARNRLRTVIEPIPF